MWAEEIQYCSRESTAYRSCKPALTHKHMVKQYLIFWQPFLHHSLVHSQHVPSSAVESPLPKRERRRKTYRKSQAAQWLKTEQIYIYTHVQYKQSQFERGLFHVCQVFSYLVCWQNCCVTSGKRWHNSECTRSRHQFNTPRSISLLFRLALLPLPSFLSRHAPLQQVPNLFSTQADKSKITHTENPGWRRCWSTVE